MSRFLLYLFHPFATFSLTQYHQSKTPCMASASKSSRIKGARIACEFGSPEAGMVARNSGVFTDILPASYVLWGFLLHLKTSTIRLIRLWCQQNQDPKTSVFRCFSWAKVWQPWQLGLGKPRVLTKFMLRCQGFLCLLPFCLFGRTCWKLFGWMCQVFKILWFR